MSNLLDVQRYFKMSTGIVYVERGNQVESFQEYLGHRYQDNCYYYSAFALMGLKPEDYLVRGDIDSNNWRYYHHGWVEFSYDEQEYVFDSMLTNFLVSKEEWYQYYNPEITYKKTQEKILNEFLNEKNAFEIKKNFWQFKEYVMNLPDVESIPIKKLQAIDKENGHVPTALMLARLEMSKYSSRPTRFLAYSPDYC